MARRLRRQHASLSTQAQQMARLALVAERTQNIVLITDERRRTVWANEAFTRVTGYALTEAIGKTPGELLQTEGTDPVGAGANVHQISRFENAHGSNRRATHAWSDVGQGLTSLSPLVAGIAARMALAAEEILAELDQEPRGGRQVIL
jgi:PAS domain S-box-containing protein